MRKKEWLVVTLVLMASVGGLQAAQYLQARIVGLDTAAGDYFGVTAAIDGDYALVGANMDDHAAGADAGAAYIFFRTGTSWAQRAKLIASDAAAGDRFGGAVALGGGCAVIGATKKNSNTGAVYVFEQSGTVAVQTAELVGSDVVAGNEFGNAMAIHQDRLIVGASKQSTNTGAAYIFERGPSGWAQVAKLTAPAGQAQTNDQFGCAVGIYGDYAMVGAQADDAGATDVGSVFVFQWDGAAWNYVTRLNATDKQASDYFGGYLFVRGTQMAVSAIGEDDKGSSAGAAYVFELIDGTWQQTAKLLAPDGAAGDSLGYGGIVIDSDTVIVGAYANDARGSNAGQAYRFAKQDGVWTYTDTLYAQTFDGYGSPISDAATNAYFGSAVGLSGSTVIVGAYGRYSNAGRTYFYVPTPPTVTVQGTVALNDFAGDKTTIPVVVEVRNVGGATALETYTVSPLTAGGGYSFVTSLTGQRDITAKASHWLRQKQSNVILSPGAVTLNFSLINGDANEDNSVNGTDLSAVLTGIDATSGGPADLDGDNEVASTDLSIVLANLDLTGDN